MMSNAFKDLSCENVLFSTTLPLPALSSCHLMSNISHRAIKPKEHFHTVMVKLSHSCSKHAVWLKCRLGYWCRSAVMPDWQQSFAQTNVLEIKKCLQPCCIVTAENISLRSVAVCVWTAIISNDDNTAPNVNKITVETSFSTGKINFRWWCFETIWL